MDIPNKNALYTQSGVGTVFTINVKNIVLPCTHYNCHTTVGLSLINDPSISPNKAPTSIFFYDVKEINNNFHLSLHQVILVINRLIPIGTALYSTVCTGCVQGCLSALHTNCHPGLRGGKVFRICLV